MPRGDVVHMTRVPTRLRSAAPVAAVAGIVVLSGLAPTSALAAPAPSIVEVRASSIADTRPAAGGWFADASGTTTDGSFAISQDSPGNVVAVKLDVPTATDKIYLYNTFAAGSRPADIPALVEGASYDYAGLNVNFQLEVIFEPVDVARYGPAGSVKACTPASTWYGWELTADPDWCYTILKWEPYVQPGNAWTHVDLSVDTAALSSTQTGGWVSSKQLGVYPGNVSKGQLLAEYLPQMADYEVTSFGFGIGSGTPGPAAGYLEQYTIGGVSYRFVLEAAAPAAPPVADADELDSLIRNEGIDVTADTERFVPTGSSNTDLSVVDNSAPLDGVLENWTDPSDAFVDVYTYSTPVYVGTFPIVGGHVVMSGVDLRHLAPGAHRFLFRGQTSGTLSVVQFTVLGLAVSGSDRDLVPVGAGLAAGLILTGVALGRIRRRSGSIRVA